MVFFFVHMLSTPVSTPSLSMQVKIQPTYLTLGGFLSPSYPTIRGSHTPTSGSCRENLEKDRLKVPEGKNKKRILEQKKEHDRKEEPLRTVNLIAPVVSKPGGAFNFNP